MKNFRVLFDINEVINIQHSPTIIQVMLTVKPHLNRRPLLFRYYNSNHTI